MNDGPPISAHMPVMVEDVIKALAVQPGGRYVDCTLGGGGHASAILEHSSPGGQLLGIDADPEAIKVARNKLADYRDSILLVNDNFVNLEAVCVKYDFFPVHGILFDLGLSSLQLESAERGFSFQKDGPLDMRFGPNQEITAADIVNEYPEDKLADLIWKYGEETFSHRIARAIVAGRPIKTTRQLAQLIERAAGDRRGKIHPATRTFQALRIAVNTELEHLESALKQAVGLLGYEGRLVVISYHSLEDRIVKQFMQREAKDCVCPPEIPACICGHKASLRLINKRVITPSLLEMQLNPRSRSAKLRAVERIIVQTDSEEISDEPHLTGAARGGWWRSPVLMQRVRTVFSLA